MKRLLSNFLHGHLSTCITYMVQGYNSLQTFNYDYDKFLIRSCTETQYNEHNPVPHTQLKLHHTVISNQYHYLWLGYFLLKCPILKLIILQVLLNIFLSWKSGISTKKLRIKMRSSNFWDVAGCQWVTCSCYLNFRILWILDFWKLGPICCAKISVMNYPLMLTM